MNYIQPIWDAPSSIKAYTLLREGDGTPLSIPNEPIWLKQTHSTLVVEAIPTHQKLIADASFTAVPNRVCAILTADCLPILLCNKQGTKVAAIHAGWRGLAKGIIEATLQALNEEAPDLLVWLGPAIGPQRFEVGRDVYEAFTSVHAEAAAAFIQTSEEKWLANLYALATLRLNLQAITHISGGEFCTYTQEDLFFSYRRDNGHPGRLVSLIWISDNR